VNQGVPYLPESAPFSPAQRQWLNGYLAGLFSSAFVDPADLATAANGGAAASATAATPAVAVTVLYGSQTGTAEGIAREAGERLELAGCRPQVADMDEYDVAALATEEHLLVICSTYGDGEMPDNAQGFWDRLASEDAPRLEATRFSVLALGDSSYETFCTAGKDLDGRLEALGASRLHDRIDCDVDFEEPFEQWMDGVLGKIVNGTDNKKVNGTKDPSTSAWGKKNPFMAVLKQNEAVTGEDSSKEIRHFAFDLADSGMTYEPGDALHVVPFNDPALVDVLLERLGCSGDEILDGTGTTVREAFTCAFEIRNPSRDLIELVAARLDDAELAASLKDADTMYGKDSLDLLNALPPGSVSLAEFAATLKKLQSRAYSISSCLERHPGEVHLTIASVRYGDAERAKQGVCSCFLADRTDADSRIGIWVKPNKNFRLPPDPETPVIMVGPGTGIAPFLGFLQRREFEATGGNNWLFFGDRNAATDFLYRDQLEGWLDSGLLTRLDLAFSRDQAEKVYVQDRMRESGAELFAWLEAGARFYVCGDAYRMAKDVDRALHDIIAEHGGLSEEEAKTYVSALKKEKRYLRDVY